MRHIVKKRLIWVVFLVCMIFYSACSNSEQEETSSEVEQSVTETSSAEQDVTTESSVDQTMETPSAANTSDSTPAPLKAITPPADLADDMSDLWDRVDGSTATIPLTKELYEFYGGTDASPVHATTHYAYRNLINGSKDIIFVTTPSPDEFDMAEDAEVELEVIPVVRMHLYSWLMWKTRWIRYLSHRFRRFIREILQTGRNLTGKMRLS